VASQQERAAHVGSESKAAYLGRGRVSVSAGCSHGSREHPLVKLPHSAWNDGGAAVGQVGFEHRREYTANGGVINLASRLCDEAKPGQIVISQRAFGAIEHRWKPHTSVS
jgi:hypothetical protein